MAVVEGKADLDMIHLGFEGKMDSYKLWLGFEQELVRKDGEKGNSRVLS